MGMVVVLRRFAGGPMPVPVRVAGAYARGAVLSVRLADRVLALCRWVRAAVSSSCWSQW